MLRNRLLLGLAALFSVALALNALPADQPALSGSQAKAEKAPPKRGGMTVTLSQKAAPTEQTIRKALDKPVQVKFKNVPLNKVVESLSKATGVNFWIDEQALTEEGVAIDEPITRQGKPLAAARLLDRILPPFGLTWIIQNDAVQITTIIAAAEILVTRVYPVGDLLAYEKKQEIQAATAGMSRALHFVQFGEEGIGGAGFYDSSTPFTSLIDILQQFTDGPWVDLDGTGGTINGVKDNLVIRQTHKVQSQCEQILDTIREFTKGHLKPNPTPIRPPHYAMAEDETVKRALSKVIRVKAIDTPLHQFLADLADALDVPLSIDRQALGEEGVAVDEPINRELENLPARAVLNIALEPLGLRAVVEDGFLVVSTHIETEEWLVTKLHDIRDLSDAGYNENAIVELLQQETAGPWVDTDGTGGTINSPLPGLLLVRQTHFVHREAEAILADLRKELRNPTNPPPEKPAEDPQAVTTRFYSIEKSGDADAIQKAVVTFVEPESWLEDQQNAQGRIVRIDSTLVVKTRIEVHKKIEQFLKDYREAVSRAAGHRRGFGGGGLGHGSGFGGGGGGLGHGGGFFQIPSRKPGFHQTGKNEPKKN